MSCPRNCAVGNSLAQLDIETVGYEALTGAITWREAERRLEDHSIGRQSLKTHMEKHVLDELQQAEEAAERDQMDLLIGIAKQELLEQFELVPADIKPLILVAIRNLEGLKLVKPSQESLIRALKTIQEMTGMKNEQRLMLDYARAQRTRPAPLQVRNEAQALPAPAAEEQ